MISEAQLRKISRNIIRKSMFVKPKEAVMIACGPNSLDFAEKMAYEAAIIGAHPTITYSSDDLTFKIYKDISNKYLKSVPKLSRIFAKKVDVQIFIDDSNPYIENKLPLEKIKIRTKALKPIKNIIDKRIVTKTVKRVLIGFPTKEKAKFLGLSYNKLSNIFWKTLGTDPAILIKNNKKIMKSLKGAETIRIVGKKTDLEFSVKGRPPLSDCALWELDKLGYLNLPAGEVFYAPVETSANGEIYFDLPCVYHFGKRVEGVWFKFKNGKVVDYKIDKGQKNFEEVMKHATGDKKRIAELGIGSNPNAKPTGGMTIIDEKVMRTIHIAIGWNKGYGGKNDSSVHWDLYKTMTRGKMFANGKLVMKNGNFI
jgi:aminopeptidase